MPQRLFALHQSRFPRQQGVLARMDFTRARCGLDLGQHYVAVWVDDDDDGAELWLFSLCTNACLISLWYRSLFDLISIYQHFWGGTALIHFHIIVWKNVLWLNKLVFYSQFHIYLSIPCTWHVRLICYAMPCPRPNSVFVQVKWTNTIQETILIGSICI